MTSGSFSRHSIKKGYTKIVPEFWASISNEIAAIFEELEIYIMLLVPFLSLFEIAIQYLSSCKWSTVGENEYYKNRE